MKECDFAVVFAILIDYFGAKPSEAVSNIYFEAFKNWSLEDFKKACQSIMESRIYNGLPKIAEIKEALIGNIEDAKILAYQSLLRATESGGYISVVFKDGAIGRAVQGMGGWQRVCEMTLDDWKYRRKEFESLYALYLHRGETDPVRLIGLFEANNNQVEGWKQFTPKDIVIEAENRLFIDSISVKERLPYKED
jgi:hypothetical protein